MDALKAINGRFLLYLYIGLIIFLNNLVLGFKQERFPEKKEYFIGSCEKRDVRTLSLPKQITGIWQPLKK
jgi:hypothetical protein